MASTAAPRPSLTLFSSEPLRAAVDLLGYLFSPADKAPLSPDPHTVVLFPGLGTDGRTMWPLRRHLGRMGYRAMDWGQGFNTGPQGDVDAWLLALRDAVLKQTDADAKEAPSMSLVGWSLGGFYARELAKLIPHRVRRVITIGTPFNGTREQTNVRWLFKWLNGQDAPASPQLLARLASPPPVPTTAIYSRKDGVVAWQACRHGRNVRDERSDVRDVEVSASHLGMGWNRNVMAAVAVELAPQRSELAAFADHKNIAACPR